MSIDTLRHTSLTPRTVVPSGITDPVERASAELKAAQEAAKYEDMSEKQASKEIKRLEKQMLDHAKNLEFEKAAQVRDQLAKLKSQLFGASAADVFAFAGGVLVLLATAAAACAARSASSAVPTTTTTMTTTDRSSA